jgi:hypothetical protein
MIKKYLIIILLASLAAPCFGQEDSFDEASLINSKHEFSYEDLDTLTKVRLNEFYNSQNLENIKKDINKMLFLNYSIAGAFKVKEGQEYEIEDYLKIDISNYKDLIQEDSTVEVFDEDSGLTIIIDSKQMASEKLELLGVEQYWEQPPSESKTIE